MNDAADIPPPPELEEPSPPAFAVPKSGKFNPRTISWWHEALADWMLLNPDKPMKDAAQVFDVTPTYVYMLKNSDSFKAYWKKRREAFVARVDASSEEILGSLRDKLGALAETAVDALQARMEQAVQAGAASNIPLAEVRETADMALKKLGYGAPTAPAGGNNLTINIANPDLLAAARAKMQAMFNPPNLNSSADEAVSVPMKDITPKE